MVTIGTRDAGRLVLFSPLLALYTLSVVLVLTPYTVLTRQVRNGYEYMVGVAGLATWTGAVATGLVLCWV